MAIIKLENLSIQAKDLHIINQMNMAVEEGEFVALTGPSGSGKSTVLKYLAQLLSPNLDISGDYFFEGKRVQDMDTIELRKQVSYCFQSPSLFGETVRDNFCFPYAIRKQTFDESRALELLKAFDLPQSYLDKLITELSGGEKQRVALIRNVLIQPKVLLLDEVTSALDSQTRNIFWQWLGNYRKETGITIVMVSHQEDEQDRADRKIVLKALEHKNETLSKEEIEAVKGGGKDGK